MAETLLLMVPIGDGSDQVVEVQVARADLNELEESGVVLAAADGGRLQAAGFTLASGIERVMPALAAVVGRLRAGSDGLEAPDEVSVQVGLQVGGEAGFYFAKGTGEANVSVTMTWRQPA
jgi:hypothetical protein